MKIGDLKEIIALSTVVELKSYRTDDPLKLCRYDELPVEDMELTIDGLYPLPYFGEKYKDHSGMLLIQVSE